MGYLLMHIWLCLLAAALLGGLLMWLVSRLNTTRLREELEALWGGKLRDAEARVSSLSGDLVRVEGQIPGLETQIADGKTRFAALEADNAGLSSKLTLLATEHQTALAAAAAAASTAQAKLQASLTSAETGLGAQINDWKAKFTALEADRSGLSAKLASLVTEHQAALAAAGAAAATLAAASAEKSKLQASLVSETQLGAQLSAELSDWKAKFATLEADKSSLAAKLNTADADRARLQSNLAATEAHLNDWKANFTVLESDKASVAAKLSSAVNEHQTALAAAAAKFAALEAEKRELAAQLANSSQAAQALGTELATTKNLLAAAEHTATLHSQQIQQVAQERDHFSGRYRSLSDEIAQAKAQLSDAIAAREDFQAQLAAARQTAPLAMAAAAGAASVTVTPPPAAPSLPLPADEWQPKYVELQSRFRSFVAAQQKEGYGDIERIEGIGPVIGQKLRQAGIAWVKTLLAEGGTAPGRKAIVEETGLNPGDILKWVNAADLLRLEGVTPDWAEMLEAAGVDTVKELRHRVPENLHKKMVETRAERPRQFHSDAPSLELIQAWITAAKSIDPAVTH